jgi:lipoate-protein ligase B
LLNTVKNLRMAKEFREEDSVIYIEEDAKCKNCGATISQLDYKVNHGLCILCIMDLQDEFSGNIGDGC